MFLSRIHLWEKIDQPQLYRSARLVWEKTVDFNNAPSNATYVLWYNVTSSDKFDSVSEGINVEPPNLYFGLWSSKTKSDKDRGDDYYRIYAAGPATVKGGSIATSGEKVYATYEDIAILRGVTSRDAWDVLTHTNPELLGFLHAQGVFASELWNEIQDEWNDWSVIPGCYPQTPDEDEDQCSLRIVKAQLLYIRGEVIGKFGRCDLYDLSINFIQEGK